MAAVGAHLAQGMQGKVAVLLVNLGSPDAPTKGALKRYLREFLSDPRVVDLPRWQWFPILYGVVLQTRPKKSAHAYEAIWQENGSPLIEITKAQVVELGKALQALGLEVVVDYAMRYGNPSLTSKFMALKAQGVEHVLVVPMYPQYSDATTASVFDGVALALRQQRFIPEIRMVRNWQNHPLYIEALAESVRQHFATHGQPERLLFSYHGVPKRYFDEGDPYFLHCQETTELVAKALGLAKGAYQMVFQSLFGKEEWLRPYADETIEQMARDGVRSMAVICPGFSADCLETLEEMAIGNRALFLEHGGQVYEYIPALNAQNSHIGLLVDLVKQHAQGWRGFEKVDVYREGR